MEVIKAKISDYFTKEFILFFVFSGLAAIVNFGSRIIFSIWLGYAISIVLAYMCGMVTSFIFNKYFVFKKRAIRKTPKQFMIFIIVNILAVTQTLIFSFLFRDVIFPQIDFTFYPEEVAHLIGVGIPVFTSFLGHKYFSFKE